MTIATTLAAAAIATTLATQALAAPASSADRKFVAMVSQGGMFEVMAGALAARQGGTQDIRDQGATEDHDHTLVGQALKTAAASAGITVPATLNAMFQAKLDALKAKSGPEFDAAYLQAMQDIHAKDGAAFAKEAADGTNPALKSFAAETHRIVVMHIGELSAIRPAA